MCYLMMCLIVNVLCDCVCVSVSCDHVSVLSLHVYQCIE